MFHRYNILLLVFECSHTPFCTAIKEWYYFFLLLFICGFQSCPGIQRHKQMDLPPSPSQIILSKISEFYRVNSTDSDDTVKHALRELLLPLVRCSRRC